MTKRQLKVAFLTTLAAILVFIGWQIYLSIEYSAKIDLLFTPTSSRVTLDNKIIKAARAIHVKPGRHVVVASKDGFTRQTQTTDVKRGETVFIGIPLDSNSDKTASWYQDHPDDQRIREKITGIQEDALSQKAAKLNPFIKLLPYYAPGEAFDIGIKEINPRTGQPTIVITTYTENAEEDALTWIKSSGYDPSKMKIEVINNNRPAPTNYFQEDDEL
ncbi:MAG: hypothetical protein WBO35_05230 [Candidatus Saccharimonadales bacterium]